MSRWQLHPILCLYRTNHQPLRRYLSEILVQQGFFQTDHIDLDHASELPQALQGRALLLVSAAELGNEESQAISDYVRNGGSAILPSPPDHLVSQLGLSLSEPASANYGCAPWGYARLQDHPDAGEHAGTLLQIPTPSVLRKVAGQSIVASFGMRPDVASTFPAVITTTCGQGEVGIFWFDPGATLVGLRQGDPNRASWPRDGIAALKPGYLFEGHVNPQLQHCPQADVWADTLTRMMQRMAAPRLPLPRVWHFPKLAPALTLLDGDSDIYDWDSYGELTEPARAAGVPYTLNLMAKHLRGIDRDRVDSLWKRGQDSQLHYWPDHGVVTVDSMQKAIGEQAELFAQNMGRRASGGRAHCLVWPGYTDVAACLAQHGFDIETNFMPFRGWQYGYLGSARPARFITTGGQCINTFQQPTTFMDDPMSNDKSLRPPCSVDETYNIVQRFYEDSVRHYHGVICTCLHPVPARGFEHYQAVQRAMRQAIIDATHSLSVPAVTTRAWGAFVQARSQLDLRWTGTAWQVASPLQIEQCTVLVPEATNTRAVTFDLSAGSILTLV